MVQGLLHGFHLGFSCHQTFQPAKRNKLPANEHHMGIDDYLANEVSLGTLPLPSLHICSFRVSPKKGQPRKWQLIVDLSSGAASVKDGINPDDFTLHYVTIDHIILMVSRFGKGLLLAKFDMEAAYQNVVITSFWAWNGAANSMLT